MSTLLMRKRKVRLEGRSRLLLWRRSFYMTVETSVGIKRSLGLWCLIETLLTCLRVRCISLISQRLATHPREQLTPYHSTSHVTSAGLQQRKKTNRQWVWMSMATLTNRWIWLGRLLWNSGAIVEEGKQRKNTESLGYYVSTTTIGLFHCRILLVGMRIIQQRNLRRNE